MAGLQPGGWPRCFFFFRCTSRAVASLPQNLHESERKVKPRFGSCNCLPHQYASGMTGKALRWEKSNRQRRDDRNRGFLFNRAVKSREADQRRNGYCTWFRCPDGRWALKGCNLQPGAVVEVRARSGRRQKVTVGAIWGKRAPFFDLAWPSEIKREASLLDEAFRNAASDPSR